MWKVIGDGCDFRDTADDISGVHSFSVKYQYLDAPIPLFIVKPHVTGIAVKL